METPDRPDQSDSSRGVFRGESGVTSAESAVDLTITLPQTVFDEVLIRAEKNRSSIETVVQAWITDKVSSAAMGVMPADTAKPFFAYGALKPGELGHDLIADEVDRMESATVTGYLWVRDGVPLIFSDSDKGQVEGTAIWFKSLRGYRQISRFEPRSFYQWGSVELSNGVQANALVPAHGLKPDRGGGDALWEPWQTARDPLFNFGLNTVSAAIRADGQAPLNPTDSDPGTWDRFYRLQSAYMLACSILERIAFRVVGAEADVTARVTQLGRTSAFIEAVDHVGLVNWGRPVFRSNDPTKLAKLNESRHFAQWAYQIRSNLMHRGKSAWHEAELVRTALIDLHDVLRVYLLGKVPQVRNAWERSWPEGSATDWQVKGILTND